MNALTRIPLIEARPVEPRSHDDWLAQYNLGQTLAGPFGDDDPQIAFRIREEWAEPATVENVKLWLRDNAVQCSNCCQYWLEGESDRPTFKCSDGMLCEDCAPCTTRRQHDPDGWKVEAGR